VPTYHVFKPTTGTGRVVTDDKTGGKLPKRVLGSWEFEREVTIDADGVPIIGADSDDVIAGVKKDGYYLWPTKVS